MNLFELLAAFLWAVPAGWHGWRIWIHWHLPGLPVIGAAIAAVGWFGLVFSVATFIERRPERKHGDKPIWVIVLAPLVLLLLPDPVRVPIMSIAISLGLVAGVITILISTRQSSK